MKISKQSGISILLLTLSCVVHLFLPVQSFVIQGRSAQYHPRQCFDGSPISSGSSLLRAQGKSDDDDNDDNAGSTTETTISRADRLEEFRAMEEANRKVTNRLMLPRTIMTTIGETIRYSAYAFLIGSFALNIAGYSVIRDGDMIRIGTLEERDFQTEIIKSVNDTKP